jgi:opacity protein-like surface antigen
MKLIAVTALLSLSSCMSVPAAPDAQVPVGKGSNSMEPRGQLAIYLGVRTLDQDLWSPVEDQGVFGFEYSHQDSPDAFGWEVGLMGSSDEGKFAGFNVRGRTGEVYAGVRKAFGNDTVRPYLGGGLSIIRGEVDAAGSDDSDTSAAAYLHAGVEFLISPTFFLGLDIRGLFGSSIDMGGVNGDADYTQGAFTFGWRF